MESCYKIHLEKGKSTTGNYYRESVLAEVNRRNKRVQPNSGMCGIKRLDDNAPCDFSLFPLLKECLAGWKVNSSSSPSDQPFSTIFHINTQDCADISARGRKTAKVCCGRQSALKCCSRRKSLWWGEHTLPQGFHTKMKHPCNLDWNWADQFSAHLTDVKVSY